MVTGQSGSCPICKSSITTDQRTGHDRDTIECPRCGKYSITGTARAVWKGSQFSGRQITHISAWLKEHQDYQINSNNLQDLLKIEPPTVGERAEKLLLEIAKRTKFIGDAVPIHLSKAAEADNVFWLSSTWSENRKELKYLLDYLTNNKKWVDAFAPGNGIQGITISPLGYEYLEERKRGGGDGSQGFCAMWFKKGMNPLWRDAIEPAIHGAGYKPLRIDRHEHTNRIDDEILAQIRRSKFVVADFSGQRRGVYFEAGFTLGLGKQVIWTIRKGNFQSIHFDNRQYNFLDWDPDDLPSFKSALQNRIEAIFGVGPLHSKM